MKMSNPIRQIVTDSINDFITRRKTADEIIADVKRDFVLRDDVLDVADALLRSPNAELRAAGKLVEVLALGWTSETPTDYLRGTNIITGQPCICVNPNAVDKTCPLYGARDHGKIIAKRFVDSLMRG